MIKTCYNCLPLALLLLSIGILETKHKSKALLSTFLAWFPLFLRDGFTFVFAYKKREPLFLANFCNFPLKRELDLFTVKRMCVKIQKIMSCKTKL